MQRGSKVHAQGFLSSIHEIRWLLVLDFDMQRVFEVHARGFWAHL